MGRPRGRPRSYDPDQVLEGALQAFWRGGFSGTSLDALAAASGLNRPSLYAGFGDKQTIYIKAMRRFLAYASEKFGAALMLRPSDKTLSGVIRRYLRTAIDVDGPQERSGLSGCAVISTAMAEALKDPKIREVLSDVLLEMDRQLYACLQELVKKGFISPEADITSLCTLLTSVVQSIGIRSRAGQTRADLERMVESITLTVSQLAEERKTKHTRDLHSR
ncbi:TetR/AcrR family transcriptional regulator [Photorhabdus antumapuensis]|uniref:TetR/AcrR family transcriptional regulator n=1 Tax=Photorhabdus antumapuensis TaxID=2862867 RepID=UPI001CEDEA68|nr:TetR/AcrR family transcriptional regulator [Photorhabdus antumapuensis]MCA6221496.1 TetR/AcrR family transcriptional regulator [Photorhabdus antumapuensis]